MSTAYVGVDLAAQPAGTAACRLVFGSGEATVEVLRAGLGDNDLNALRDGARVVGIDSPFGWPRAFARAVGAWSAGEGWVAGGDVRELRFRATDREVQRRTGPWPLSVSTDRIGVCAFRCAALLARWGVEDRTGDEEAAACAASHDVLDALVCALLARAVDLGATAPPPAALGDLAREEGWIHVPAGELAALFAS